MNTCIFLNSEKNMAPSQLHVMFRICSHTIGLILSFDYDGKIHVNINMRIHTLLVPMFYLG